MANRRKVADDVFDTGPVSKEAGPDVRIGDIVIYNHRPMTTEPNVPAMFPSPMIVTAVHGTGNISGVVMTHNAHLGFMGTKVVNDASSGQGPGEWHKRT